MNVLEVTVSEIQNAASKISAQNEAFRDAMNSLQNATNALSDSWTGAAHEDFVAAMTDRFTWYTQMAEIVDSYVKMMQDAASRYTDTDSRAAAAIRKK